MSTEMEEEEMERTCVEEKEAAYVCMDEESKYSGEETGWE